MCSITARVRVGRKGWTGRIERDLRMVEQPNRAIWSVA